MDHQSISFRGRVWIGVLFVGLSTFVSARNARAQEEVRFSGGEEANASCPPEILGVYWAPDRKITFWGNSIRQTMIGNDTRYDFEGKNLAGTMQVTGWFIVKQYQCPAAWYSYVFNLPNVIATLHDRVITQLASGGELCDPTLLDYDPYSNEDACDSGADAGGTSGSGTFYEPGDHTGGEMVSWETGQGIGGSSMCGAAAVVEYVCIEVFNENTQQWEVYACGYATVC